MNTFEVLVVGTTSNLKLRAVNRALVTLFPSAPLVGMRAVEVRSGVPDQPLGADMTLQGAKNRALRARETWYAQKKGTGEVGRSRRVAALGIESGLVLFKGETFFDVPFAAALTPDNQWGYGMGAGLQVPASMAQEALSPGNELGAVVQRLTGGGEKDPHRYLTEGKVLRERAVEEAVLGALIAAFGPRYRDH